MAEKQNDNSCAHCGSRTSEFATLAQAAAFTCGSRTALYDWAKKGKIELVRLGGRTLIRWTELERFANTAEPWVPRLGNKPDPAKS